MEKNMQFLIMVDTDKSRREVLKLILDRFSDAIQRKSNSCDLRDNWIEVWENSGADPNLSDSYEKGYLYYKWRVEVTPLKRNISETKQVQLARDLLSCFKAEECKAVVCANFEDKV